MSTAINSLSVPLPFLTAEETDTIRNSSFTLNCDANTLGLERINLSFDAEGHCRISLNSPEASFDFDCGLDIWKEGKTDRLSPYYMSRRRNPAGIGPFNIAGYFSQTSPGELSIRLLYTEDYQEETFIFRLKGNSFEGEYSNGFRKNDPPTEIKGKFVKQ